MTVDRSRPSYKRLFVDAVLEVFRLRAENERMKRGMRRWYKWLRKHERPNRSMY